MTCGSTARHFVLVSLRGLCPFGKATQLYHHHSKHAASSDTDKAGEHLYLLYNNVAVGRPLPAFPGVVISSPFTS